MIFYIDNDLLALNRYKELDLYLKDDLELIDGSSYSDLSRLVYPEITQSNTFYFTYDHYIINKLGSRSYVELRMCVSRVKKTNIIGTREDLTHGMVRKRITVPDRMIHMCNEKETREMGLLLMLELLVKKIREKDV